MSDSDGEDSGAEFGATAQKTSQRHIHGTKTKNLAYTYDEEEDDSKLIVADVAPSEFGKERKGKKEPLQMGMFGGSFVRKVNVVQPDGSPIPDRVLQDNKRPRGYIGPVPIPSHIKFKEHKKSTRSNEIQHYREPDVSRPLPPSGSFERAPIYRFANELSELMEPMNTLLKEASEEVEEDAQLAKNNLLEIRELAKKMRAIYNRSQVLCMPSFQKYILKTIRLIDQEEQNQWQHTYNTIEDLEDEIEEIDEFVKGFIDEDEMDDDNRAKFPNPHLGPVESALLNPSPDSPLNSVLK